MNKTMAEAGLIIIDKKMPLEAKRTLRQYGDLLELQTSGITYPAISGHPDIFFCQTPAGLVVAPELPDHYLVVLQQKEIQVVKGVSMPGNIYPQTAHYNAVASSKLLIHNLKVTDPIILDACKALPHIHVNQAYTRCNLLALNNIFLTSDKGIHNTLMSKGVESNYYSPEGIQLEGFNHGFLGGACGVFGGKVFVCGSLKYYSQGKEFKQIVENDGYDLVELYDGPLVDVGSILMCKVKSAK